MEIFKTHTNKTALSLSHVLANRYQITCNIIDGMALAQAICKPENGKTFGDHANVFVQAVFSKLSQKCPRVDLVFDIYKALLTDKVCNKTKLGILLMGQKCNYPLSGNTSLVWMQQFLTKAMMTEAKNYSKNRKLLCQVDCLSKAGKYQSDHQIFYRFY